MDYFSILNLNREPFSNSPDPDFFYGSRQHLDCLQKLELALRLRRGLNVIIGDVGTGKTTLCRQLIRRFTDTEEFETHLILDPHFTSTTEFLASVAAMFKGRKPARDTNDWQLKELIKQYLFGRGVDEGKTVILIIDEGQKLPIFCMELLREFLNYETNEFKLLQIVIFAQVEFQNTIRDYSNFADRINLYHFLKPMNFRDSRAMIRFRLEKSSNNFKTYSFFSMPALMAIYLATGGYPRKIINLCHRCILTMIIQNRSVVDLFLARMCIGRVFPNRSRRTKKLAVALGLPAVALTVLIFAFGFNWFGFLPAFSKPTARPGPPVESQLSRAPRSPAPEPSAPAEMPTDSKTAPAPAIAPAPVAMKDPMASAAPTASEQSNPPEETGQSDNRRYADSLGQVTLMQSETLSGLIQSVYGDYNSKYFKSLILANPAIDDPDRVTVGQTVVLPAIPAAVKPPDSTAWWVRLASKDSLDEAYRYLRALPRGGPSIRLLPYWQPGEGMQFALVLDQYFVKKSSATRRLQQLPRKYAAGGEVLSLWSNEAVFFADPFFGHRAGNRG